jgi:hypothetical protein
VEQTDSHSYDLNFGDDYHGNEWIARCDERCQGRTCGACSYADLKIRNGYLRSVDDDVNLATIQPVDQHSQTVRLRARVSKPIELRYVGNDHWRFAFRRACFRAQTKLGLTHGIAKRSIRFASDEVKYRDWTYGNDYVEFALTRAMSDYDIGQFIEQVHLQLEGRMAVEGWVRHPANAVTIRSDADITLFAVEVDAQLDALKQRLAWWDDQEHVPMRLKIEGGYFAPNSEQVNAQDYVRRHVGAIRDGHRLHAARCCYAWTAQPVQHRRPPSWASNPGCPTPRTRLSASRCSSPPIATSRTSCGPSASRCGLGIPITLLDRPFDAEHCPHCLDLEKELTP